MCDTGELAIHGVTVQPHGGAGESKFYTVSHCHTAAVRAGGEQAVGSRGEVTAPSQLPVMGRASNLERVVESFVPVLFHCSMHILHGLQML